MACNTCEHEIPKLFAHNRPDQKKNLFILDWRVPLLILGQQRVPGIVLQSVNFDPLRTLLNPNVNTLNVCVMIVGK